MSRFVLLIAILAVALASSQTVALINPNYTPVDLVRDSSVILVLRVTAPRDGRMAAEVVETLAGTAPAQKSLTFDFSSAQDFPEEKVNAVFAGQKTALGVMCVQKKKQEGAVVGAMEIGTTWLGLTQGEDKSVWNADGDPKDNPRETVWGGSARRLVPAIRYTLSDSSASFPVVSNMSWSRDLYLRKMGGDVHGCLVTTDGVVVLCDGGDRIFRPGTDGQPPIDITQKLNLASKSKAMAAGDFNGDGRLDLASWDGAKLWLVLREADGKFAAAKFAADLADCISLEACGGGLIAGGAKGITLLVFDGKGAFTAKTIAGAGGPCAVADFNGDGFLDMIQISPDSLAFYAGQREAMTFAASVVTKLAILKKPMAIECADFDNDGQVDLLVTGEGGAALLSRDDGNWTSISRQTGELAEALAAGEATIVAVCVADINGDGRPGIATFRAGASPSLFFNRGFAAFGAARTLGFTESTLAGAVAMSAGQRAGVFCDLNGDGADDLLAVDRQNKAWVILAEAKDPREQRLTIESAAHSPLTIQVALGNKPSGIRVVRPGQPMTLRFSEATKVTLKWKAADGSPVVREVIVEGPSRVRL